MWPFSGLGNKIKENIKDEVNTQAMLQREVQMAVGLGQSRDVIQIYGTLWATLFTGATLGKLAGKPVPSFAFIPLIGAGIFLGNMVDVAYGTKMARVVKEAEYILEHERHRFVPPKQITFHKKYTDSEKKVNEDVSAVGDLYPSFHPFSRKK